MCFIEKLILIVTYPLLSSLLLSSSLLSSQLFRSDPSSYNAEKLTSEMQSLQTQLLPHLKAEEETVTKEFLAAHFSEQEVWDMHARIGKLAKHNDLTLDIPLVWYNIGPEDRQRTFLDAGKMPFVSDHSTDSAAECCCC